MREQLLELLDERHEAGPTAYVVQRASVETTGDGGACVELVFQPTAGNPYVGIRFVDLSGEPESLAWHIYNSLEAGSFPVPSGEPGSDGVRWN